MLSCSRNQILPNMLKYTKNSGDYCFALCDGYDECFVHWTTHHELLHTFMCQDHMYDVRPPAPLCDAHGQSAGADLASSALTCCAASCLRAACHICCSSCKSCPVTTTGSNTWETCLTQWCCWALPSLRHRHALHACMSSKGGVISSKQCPCRRALCQTKVTKQQ